MQRLAFPALLLLYVVVHSIFPFFDIVNNKAIANPFGIFMLGKCSLPICFVFFWTVSIGIPLFIVKYVQKEMAPVRRRYADAFHIDYYKLILLSSTVMQLCDAVQDLVLLCFRTTTATPSYIKYVIHTLTTPVLVTDAFVQLTSERKKWNKNKIRVGKKGKSDKFNSCKKTQVVHYGMVGLYLGYAAIILVYYHCGGRDILKSYKDVVAENLTYYLFQAMLSSVIIPMIVIGYKYRYRKEIAEYRLYR
ncbi:hypothetical protein ENBRE01_0389 [Enteropsectra breve]|nr:hypothetical protein ENBRE01_0389 [Enteropsectra breve]